MQIAHGFLEGATSMRKEEEDQQKYIGKLVQIVKKLKSTLINYVAEKLKHCAKFVTHYHI